MQRRKCIGCGYMIFKSSTLDPYLCRDCEEMLISDEPRYSYLDDA